MNLDEGDEAEKFVRGLTRSEYFNLDSIQHFISFEFFGLSLSDKRFKMDLDDRLDVSNKRFASSPARVNRIDVRNQRASGGGTRTSGNSFGNVAA